MKANYQRLKENKGGSASFIVSGISSSLILLLPKCPVCIAAFSSIFAALGVNTTFLYTFRIALIFIFIASILWLVYRAIQSNKMLLVSALALSTVLFICSVLFVLPKLFTVISFITLSATVLWSTLSYSKKRIDCEDCSN